MPRFLNERETAPETSASQPGMSDGSTSRTVTCVPRSAIIDANSQPTAPPPMTTADAGSRSSSRISSELITSCPSISNPGMVLGTDPAASTTCLPTSSEPSSTRTR